MRVIVEQPYYTACVDGKRVTAIDMNFHNQIQIWDIKKAVSRLTEMPWRYFNLVQVEQQEKILEEMKKLTDYTSADLIRLQMIVHVPDEWNGNVMQIFYKNFTGKTRTIGVFEHDTVNVIKQMITQIEGIPFDQQCLIFGGRQLEHGTLLDNKVTKEATLHLTGRLLASCNH